MKKFLVLLLLFAGVSIQAQTTGNSFPQTRLASFMAEGANARSFRHFLVLPNGMLESFAPGESPMPFPGIGEVSAISAGTFHMLALKKDGTVWAWGRNDEKQLGNEALMKSGTNSAAPVQVTGVSRAIAIAAVGNNSYALLSDGTVLAWGYGNMGMTGDGKALTSRNISANWSARGLPVKVTGIHNAIAISGPMALLADGTVMTWGDGYWGQLGNGSTEASPVPVPVKGLPPIVAIASRGTGNMALAKDGTVWAWGQNEKGQLGRKPVGDNDQSNVPVQVPGINHAVAIDAGAVCTALLQNGTVKVWGWGAIGGMGQGRPGTNDVNFVPLTIPLPKPAIAVKSGNGYAMAVLNDGTLMGWGVNMVATGTYRQTWTLVVLTKIDLR